MSRLVNSLLKCWIYSGFWGTVVSKAEKDPGPHEKEQVINNRKLKQAKGTDRVEQGRHGSCSLGGGGPEQPATESLGRAFFF